jgi:hypothetical protein
MTYPQLWNRILSELWFLSTIDFPGSRCVVKSWVGQILSNGGGRNQSVSHCEAIDFARFVTSGHDQNDRSHGDAGAPPAAFTHASAIGPWRSGVINWSVSSTPATMTTNDGSTASLRG